MILFFCDRLNESVQIHMVSCTAHNSDYTLNNIQNCEADFSMTTCAPSVFDFFFASPNVTGH